jgi:hypothetical protein
MKAKMAHELLCKSYLSRSTCMCTMFEQCETKIYIKKNIFVYFLVICGRLCSILTRLRTDDRRTVVWLLWMWEMYLFFRLPKLTRSPRSKIVWQVSSEVKEPGRWWPFISECWVSEWERAKPPLPPYAFKASQGKLFATQILTRSVQKCSRYVNIKSIFFSYFRAERTKILAEFSLETSSCILCFGW